MNIEPPQKKIAYDLFNVISTSGREISESVLFSCTKKTEMSTAGTMVLRVIFFVVDR